MGPRSGRIVAQQRTPPPPGDHPRSCSYLSISKEMKGSEPNRFWIIWILFGLLLPMLAVFFQLRHRPQLSDVNPPTGPTIGHSAVGEMPQSENLAITEDEKEVTDAVLEELLEDALSAEENEVGLFLRTDYEPLIDKYLLFHSSRNRPTGRPGIEGVRSDPQISKSSASHAFSRPFQP